MKISSLSFLLISICLNPAWAQHTGSVTPETAGHSEAQKAVEETVTENPASGALKIVKHEESLGVAPQIAFGWLKNGNNRYLTGHNRKDGRGSSERQKLAGGQHPHTIVLSCSDSRVPPELVFDQGLGEIFVVRVAGEALDSSAIASVEYAAEHLGARLILVMGHTSCGAVKAAITTPEGKSAGSPDLDKLVADIRPRLGDVSKPSQNLSKEVELNAKGVAKDLLARSSIIKHLVSENKVEIRSAVYELDSGRVLFH